MAQLLDIVVEPKDDRIGKDLRNGGTDIVSWVMGKVDPWEDHRRMNYDEKWKELYRLVRGIFHEEDKTRESENSKLISPALQQAVEATVAELEEATFGKGIWFDIDDDAAESGTPDELDMYIMRDLLREDLDLCNIPAEVSRVYLNGAIFGTGIAKILVEETKDLVIVRDESQPINSPDTREMTKFKVRLEAINPLEFAIDPGARNIDEALGCAHIINKPKHTIQAKQNSGIYRDAELGSYPEGLQPFNDLEERNLPIDTNDLVRIVEYHGLVPRQLLEEVDDDKSEVINRILTGGEEDTQAIDETDMVEAIVTIANGSALLKATENPLLKRDRSIIAYQHDTVNETFWGLGVAAKGYNSQKHLDAELRARVDAMALAAHPMIGMDATRIPRGANYKVKPGKIWLTTGNPGETFMPFNLFGGNQHTFHQAGDLERMVQMSTGAMDSASPVSQNPRNQTASGMSMMQSQFIKRNKRTMQNIDRNFLQHLIMKSAWRYSQFDPARYPAIDPKFKVVGAMGIAAREFEIGHLTQLMSVVPPDSPMASVLIKGIFEQTSLANKNDLLQALQQADQPDPAEQAMQQLQQQAAQLEVQKLRAEIEKLQSETVENQADAQAKLAGIGALADKNHIEFLKVNNPPSTK